MGRMRVMREMGLRIASHEVEKNASKEPATQQWRLRSYQKPTSAVRNNNVNVCFVNERQVIEQGPSMPSEVASTWQ
jgi:hypothetical protein